MSQAIEILITLPNEVERFEIVYSVEEAVRVCINYGGLSWRRM